MYTYCANNPLIYTDPSGHSWIKTKWNDFKKWSSNKYQTVKKKATKVVSTAKKAYSNSSLGKATQKLTKAVKNSEFGKSVNRAVSGAKTFYTKHEQTIKKIAVGVATAGAVALGVAATVVTGGLAGAVVGGALIGLGMGIGGTAIYDHSNDGKLNKSFKEYVANGIGGAVTGAIGGIGATAGKIGFAAVMSLGATSMMAGDMSTQYISKGSIDPTQALQSGAIGALTAGAFYGGAKAFGAVKSGLSSNNVPKGSSGARTIPQQLTQEGKVPVIGKMKDLNIPENVTRGEFKVADYLPDMGNPKANWKQNSGILRSIMNEGIPIKDVSMFPMDNAGFLGAERNLLQSRGWTYLDGYWYPTTK